MDAERRRPSFPAETALSTEWAAENGLNVERSTVHFDCFDGLRAMAALLVLLFHVTRAFPPTWMSAEGWRWVDRVGPFGVCVFFLISGFLLYRPFAAASISGRAMPRSVPFWIRRIFRIFPAYWVVLSVASVVLGVVTIGSVTNAVTYFALLQNYREGLTFAGLSVAWTLVIEISFYALLPFIAAALRAWADRGGPGMRYRRLAWGVTGIYLLGLFGRFLIHQSIGVIPKPTGQWFAPDQAIASILCFMDWFALGMMLALASLRARGDSDRQPRTVHFLGDHPGVAWGGALIGFVTATRLDIPAGELTPVSGLQAVALSVALGISAVFLLTPAVFGVQLGGRVRGFLRTRVMVLLGTVAYGIYLWHVPFKNVVARWTRSGYLPDVYRVQMPVVLALSVVAAALTYWIVERPLIRWSRRITSRPPRQTPSD